MIKISGNPTEEEIAAIISALNKLEQKEKEEISFPTAWENHSRREKNFRDMWEVNSTSLWQIECKQGT